VYPLNNSLDIGFFDSKLAQRRIFHYMIRGNALSMRTQFVYPQFGDVLSG
jgi:hypothetical protein